MMVALGESSQRVLREQLKDMPANFLEIAPGKFFGDPDAAKTQGLTAADVDVLRRQGFVYSISPEVTATAMLRLGSLNSNATVTGGNEDYFETSGLRFDLGASFSGQDVSAQRQVVVIDTNVRKRFFGDQNSLVKIINVAKLPCIVIGVVAKNLTMESPGAANRLDVYMPFTTVGARLLGYSRLNFVEMRFREGLPGEAVERGVEDILKRRHHVKDFSIYNMEKWVQSKKVFTDTTTYLLGAIGLVSLIVGGIGVMNIMLVSVSERAREIGIRMAVGARRSDVRGQFLTEAVVVCLIGGVAGVIISFGVSYFASFFLPREWELTLSPGAIAAAVASASLTGIIFGYIPARNASTLDPVEALSRD
jgi:macrolide transport system ATP-binding/permease protein